MPEPTKTDRRRYRTTFMGMPVTFSLQPIGPGRFRAVGTATTGGAVKVGFDADVKLRVGVNDPDGVIMGVMQMLAKLQAAGGDK